MKPKDLKSPFNWENRRVIIQDRVWFVPDCLQDDPFEFPGWSDPAIFGNDLSVHVEYCSGNGAWIASKAAQNPHINWVAVEKKFERVRLIWAKIKQMKLNNLFILFGEGFFATSQYFPEASVSETYINFPDPWPKRRHAKNRIVQTPFINQISRILKKEGSLTVVTDDLDFSGIIIDVMKNHPDFQPHNPTEHYISHLEGYGTSYFEELWRQKGKEIRYHLYKKLEAFQR